MHRFLSEEAYWATGRPRETQDRLIDEASRIVGLYYDGEQIGFCRAFTDGLAVAYLADVYVRPEHRGRGLGEELVREMIDNGPYAERQVAAAHDGRASALPQVRVRGAELQGAGAPGAEDARVTRSTS